MSSILALFGGSPVRTRPFPAWPVFGRKEERRLLRALRSGRWGKQAGHEVTEFEGRFAAMHGCRHGIAVVNGTAALRVALIAAGVEAGDEVIVPPYTFYATASSVVEVNAVPVFADVDLETFNLDPLAVATAITRRTRAIIPVHFGGQPADMPAIMALAATNGLTVIEDAAHAHGATLAGSPAGSLGHLATFSFQSSKNLTAGEGGIITTGDEDLAARCRALHNCGRMTGGAWYEHYVLGSNYRLGEFQGAVLNAQLDRLERQAQTRERNGCYLAERLLALPGVHPQRRPAAVTRHSYHLFMMRLDETLFGAPRVAVIRAMQAEGVPCSGGYPLSLYEQVVFRDKIFGPYLPQQRDALDYRGVRCPNSDRICHEQGLWIEQNVMLGTRSDMDDVFRAFEKVWQQRGALTAWHRRERLGLAAQGSRLPRAEEG